MRITWEALKQSLAHTAGTLGAKSQFDEMKALHEPLARFSNPDSLVAYLNHAGGDLDEKDRIYAALVTVAQAGGDDTEVAVALVWLGLWPGLTATYGRRLPEYEKEPWALVSEIAGRFTAAIHTADLSRIRRPAATLILNLRRDLREDFKREQAERKNRRGLPEESRDDRDDDEASGRRRRSLVSSLLQTPGLSELGRPPHLGADDDIEALRSELAAVLGEADADLVLGAVFYGNQREVGERLGLSHEASRKRHQHAIKRLRKHFGDE